MQLYLHSETKHEIKYRITSNSWHDYNMKPKVIQQSGKKSGLFGSSRRKKALSGFKEMESIKPLFLRELDVCVFFFFVFVCF